MRLFPPLRPNFDAALRDVRAKDPTLRAAAAERLGDAPAYRVEEARAALRAMLEDRSGAVRAQAMASLARTKDATALDAILARFEDGDPTVRQVALIAAAELGDRAALPALKEALASDRPEVRFQAVASIALLAPDEAAEALSGRVDDPDTEVRAHLADALGALEDPRAAETLAALLDDDAPHVARGAAIGLARLGDARGVPQLIVALDDRDRCLEAAWALGELKAAEAREPLARLAGSFLKPLAFKAAAAAALVRLGDERGVPALRGVLGALRWDARSYAVQLVGELRATELAPELAALARRPRGTDPVVLAEALAKLAPESEAAYAGLRTLALRDDEAGERALELLEQTASAS